MLKLVVLNVCPVLLYTAINGSSPARVVGCSSHVTYKLLPDTLGGGLIRLFSSIRVGPFGSRMLKLLVLKVWPVLLDTAIKASLSPLVAFERSIHVTYTLLPNTTGLVIRSALVSPWGSARLRR